MTIEEAIMQVFNPQTGIAAGVGAGVYKLSDFLLARRKQKSDADVSAFTATTTAQAALVEGLFAQIKLLQQQVADLQAEADQYRREAHEATRKAMELEGRLSALEARYAPPPQKPHPEEEGSA
jgi:phage shock protein A